MKNFVITIGRQCGSGGLALGESLAKALDVPFYDNNLVDMASKKVNLHPEVSKHSDETATRSFLYSIATGATFGGILGGHYEMPIGDKLFVSQSDVIKELAHKHSCVIVGRCANYILRNEPDINHLSVFTFADMDYRLKRIKDTHNLNDAKAKEKILKTDKKRRTFYNYYSNGTWGNAADYDLCLNMSLFGPELAQELIIDCVKKLQNSEN